jgi:DNA repair ATPase RecN
MSESAVDYAGHLIARRARQALVWYLSGRPTLERVDEALHRVEAIKDQVREAHSNTLRIGEQLDRIHNRLSQLQRTRRPADG